MAGHTVIADTIGECGCCGGGTPNCAAEEYRDDYGVSDNNISVLSIASTGYPLVSYFGVGPGGFNDYFDIGQFGTSSGGLPDTVSLPLVGTTGVNAVTVTISGPSSADIHNIGTFSADLGPGTLESVPSELSAGSGTGFGVGDELLFLDPTPTFTIEFSGGNVYGFVVGLTSGAAGSVTATVQAWDSGGNTTTLNFTHDTFVYTGFQSNGAVQAFPALGETLSKVTITSNSAAGFGFGHFALCTSKAS